MCGCVWGGRYARSIIEEGEEDIVDGQILPQNRTTNTFLSTGMNEMHDIIDTFACWNGHYPQTVYQIQCERLWRRLYYPQSL
jgi:hypothetical protein